ncbi:ABC transporter substrate-binding protein [Sphaerospermopsis sp. FACHB-1194]|uniref:ABC transporter substrate-binding protein n=1 Tax=Sphaerospermopsis sp. FACHB-1194 TaxID=2692862 RepID=UPI0016807011|nr:ABC transporter substrate-binding protein [Sphaerospermopsis sp. FACHB-1194]MBD2143708.1 ABC transporter substrate-binding protein [Sphaerospermopsis sp. FACHB-1194]
MNPLSNLPPNPYIVGIPIKKPEDFFGREEVFSAIADNLSQDVQLTLLYGQRRIGKSSVLNLIPKKISSDKFIFIAFDFQTVERLSNAEILCRIAREILEKLEALGYLPDEHLLLEHLAENIIGDYTIFGREFLPEVYRQIVDKKIVFLWDEFDVIMARNDEQENQQFADYIIQILEREQKLTQTSLFPRLFIIPIVGREINKLPTLVNFLRTAINKPISLLDKDNIAKLITQPAVDILTFDTSAIDAIFNLSAGSPYFTQVICHTIYSQVSNNYLENPQSSILNITATNVENILDQAIIAAQGGLSWFWEGLNSQQQVVVAAAAEAKNIALANHRQHNKSYPIEEPLTLLTNDYGIEITKNLTDAYEQLCEYKFLDETRRQVKIEFVRLWLIRQHPLQDTLRNENNLQNINKEEVEQLLLLADNLREGNPDTALNLYRESVRLNPNNFKSITALAKEYLSTKHIDEAVKLHKRIYKFYYKTNFHQLELILQPLLDLARQKSEAKDFNEALELCRMADQIDSEQSKHTLIDVREDYGHNLMLNQEWAKAEEQFKLVLEINPNSRFSRRSLAQIESQRTGANGANITLTENVDYPSVPVSSEPIAETRRLPPQPIAGTPHLLNRILTLKGVLGLAIIAILGLGGYGLFTTVSKPCRPGENKEFGIRCVVDNSKISRGDRTLFPEISNKFRDQGIHAFKKGNYTQAAELFKKATEANKNDPEVRIYYNNALAHQQGSPFTFAVVIPIDSISISNGQEILRGVATAQQKFNNEQFNQQNQGSNARLLEIVIANDGNANAEQVAKQLANDTSILGVIGHNSSDATQKALPIYEKAKLPVISPTSTSILLNNPVFFRSVYSDKITGAKLAEYACEKMNLQKVVIFANPNSPYSNSIREEFTKKFEKLLTSNKKLPCEVVRGPLIDLTATGFDAEKEVARSVYTHKAEAALLVPNTDKVDIAVNIAREITKRNEKLKIRNTRPEVKMLAGDTLYNHDITIVRGGKNVEGLIIAIPWFRGTPAAQKFAKELQQLWGGDVSWRTATSFDATQAFIKSLSNGASRKTVLGNLKNVNLATDETSGYPLEFTEERERQGESILLQVKDGKLIEIK